MLDKLINLGFQIVSDEVEEAVNNQSIPFDWNIIGFDESRPALTPANGRSLIEPNPEHIRRKINAIFK